ncbi:3-oxoadipyl-CoA thiolase [Pseudohaliea rubra]|uniref:Beta-ketoadipyl-CoA thiolase n=1 Tax=Pseudohaliea rubra DSM 19751 TaxID=1265313 RepID=A0A095X117_9GAMM|nr:3-oxoadipyl-CoA thiolase [Pseudohaliea rubra]KGE04564.1 3-ketoacyl-CoA thiolase [Pseudohaliea rubra DSM 19751]
MREAFVCGGVRTPIGRYGGALAAVRADDLAAVALRALLERCGPLDPSVIDDVILGCANQAGEDNRNVARMAALLAGLPVAVPGVTVNRLCASGLDAVAAASRQLRAGDSDVVIAGGVESMSRAPLVMPKAEAAFSRQAELFDTTIGWRFVNAQMKALYGTDSMPETAEHVAREFAISREDQDAFALRSQQRTARAIATNRLARELVPVRVPGGRGAPVEVAVDEHPRAGTTLERLAALRPIVCESGTVTAGNASGVNDGAAALLMASEEAVRVHALEPLARIVGACAVGVPPRIMGIGPAPAVQALLQKCRVSLADIGVIELNEAFASQALAVLRELGLEDEDERVNPNGGAIALGHPLGMSGARLALTAALELGVRGERYALCCMCVGVGQGVALLLERV